MTKRNEKGQFVKGAPSGNPNGRLKRVTEIEYHQATMAACTIDDWAQIIKAAVVDAKLGDTRARSFLHKAIFGDTPSVNILNILTQQTPEQIESDNEATLNLLLGEIATKGKGSSQEGVIIQAN